MICKSYIRSVIVQAGHIVTSTKARVHFNNTDRFCMLANSRNRAFRASLARVHFNNTDRFCMLANSRNRAFRVSLRMMVDTGATDNQGSVFDVLPDKDEDGEYTSGGCKSEGGKLSCGYSSFRGKRATMEDFYDVKMSKIDGQMVCLFGIFDGHGGSRAAQYLKEHLFDNLMKHPQFMTDTKLAISESYQQTDADFLDSERDTYRDDGSTASTAVLVGNHLYVANVGDSRTVISKAGKAIALSEDHKPNRSDERKRIENAGGVVMWAGTWRVGGVLAMSRAFGNRMLKQYVVAEPEIQDQVVDDDFEFLVLASDGVWDVLTNEVAVEVAKTEEEPEAAARKLTAVAFCRGSADNITCIVVKFQHDKAEPASAHQD
ncbi:probable protein phosphatase 2C 76 isoform X1 [Malus sylvestris]|uniref:probable protein phosphatase 2C 76 isoform X1 n=1 Tax=Malus sylvestris TaxID=3752 RepID=UPI0021AC4859|nr:probable protein phosphatase 2C 76 isoform X1 [Malus sylvestris]